jgi:glycerophosphoryl diester phosphodiesterase
MNLGRSSLRRAVIAVVLGLLIMAGGGSVAVTRAGPRGPAQFYRPLGQHPTAGEHPVIPIAHNAGDDAKATLRAIERGADAVEIDVLIYDGRLHAAHHLPKTRLNHLAWRFSPPSTLEGAWKSARSARYVQLDLKTTSPEVVPLLLDFLEKRHDDGNLIVSSPDLDALNRVADAYPDVDAVLSIDSLCRLANVRADPASLDSLRGVSVRASLLDEDVVADFHDEGLFVLAWTVDDLGGLDRVLRLDVDAVATNNLAIIERLGGVDDEPDGVGLHARRMR